MTVIKYLTSIVTIPVAVLIDSVTLPNGKGMMPLTDKLLDNLLGRDKKTEDQGKDS